MNYKNQPSFTFHTKIIIYCLPNYHPGHHLEGDNKIAQNEKKKTNTMQEFITQKYSIFFSISMGHFFKHETLISEGWK